VGQRRSAAELLIELGDHVDELVNRQCHAERYSVWTSSRHREWREHRTDHPCLLDQLRQRADPSFRERGDLIAFGVRSFGQRPPVDMQAVTSLHAIEDGSREWARGPVVDMRLRRMVGKAATLPVSDLGRAAAAARSWRSLALTACGWQTSVAGARCPECHAASGPRGLRIRVDREAARCQSCRATWDAGSLGILARRIEADDDRAQAG
jgi:hypothetical protein